ncbi:uncharacterized protein [Dendropsophus ebraccatus]|uniref:uncharacterized protein n=1 Tax=Dendropsophus ebraccatus TaxID=150705 RepID=UPI0038318B1B
MQNTERSTRSSKRYVTEPVPNREPQNAPPDTGQYICIECSETFNNKLELNSHRQSHVTKKQFTCSHCGRGFHHQFFLQMHERSHEDGIPRTPLTKPSTGRVISTRSSKPLPETDVIHVTAAPSKSVYHLNSKVEFKREWKVSQEVTPTECVTRRTQGTYSPPCQRTDSVDRKTQFELRISKLSDSTVRLIDPYGNTLEILAEVFNSYTIGEADEEDGSVSPSSDSRTSEIPAAPPSSTVYPDKPDQMGALSPPQAEISETDDTINEDAMEDDLPLCPMESVSSASASPKTMPDLCDEDISPAHTPRELDTPCVTGNEGIVSQPDAKAPRNDEGTTMTCSVQMIPEAPIVGDGIVCNNELSEVTARTGVPTLQVGAQDDPISVPVDYSELLQRSLLQKEDKSPEPSVRINYQEKDGNGYDIQTVLKDPSVTDSLDLSKDKDQLVITGAKDAQEPKSDLDFIIEHKTGLEDSGEVSLSPPDETQNVTMLEGDSVMLQTPVTERVSESDERQKESANIFSSTDGSSLDHDPVLQADLAAATGVFNIPIDDAKVNPKDGNDTASKHGLEPGVSDAEISKLSQGVYDEASGHFPSVDVSSESKSLSTASAVISVDTPNPRTLGPLSREESPVERDIDEKVLTSLEKQVSQPDMSDRLSPIASGTMPILQDVPPEQGLETKEGDGQGEYEKDLLAPDPPQTNDSTLEPSPDNDPGSLLHHIQPPEGSHVEQDVNLTENKTESDISFAVRQSTKKEETDSEASGVTPAETDSLTSTENTIDNASSEDIQAPVQDIRCVDTEMSVEESGEEIPFSLLEPQAVSAADDILPLCDEDLSLGTCAESVSFSVPTLVSITSACVKAQERILIQETEPTEQDTAASLSDKKITSTRHIESSDLKDDILLQKLEGEDLGASLCLLEPTLELSPDLEDLSEKCLLSSDEMKDLTESDIEKNLSHDDPQKQYIQMSNANLTENDLADDFVGSGTILLDAPSLKEATKGDDISSVSVGDEGTSHELADMLSPEVQESEYTEGQDDKQVGFGGLCLKCGRRVRRGRKELVWFPVCYKCRLKAKREERLSGEGTSSDFSSFCIKQETDPVQDDSFYKAAKPGHDINSIKQESGTLHRKMYKCPKCEKAFKFPALLASHMKCHSSPQCLTCGCPLTLKYKTKRIPKRCHKCLQKLKRQRKEEKALSGADHKDSLESDSGSVSADDSDLESLSSGDDEENEPSLTSTKIDVPKPGSVRKGTEPFHSIFMRERKKMNPAIRALYCTCDVLKSGGRQSKICKSCQKPVRDRLATGSHVHCQTIEGKQLKKGKRQSPIETERQNLLLGDSSLSHENESPDEFCKEEDNEPFTELDISDQSVAPDGEKPRLCPECGKVFKCNRSLHLHLLSHSATQCESCGCRLQKKKRAGRWSKKCRVCRLLTKEKGLPDSAIEGVLPSDKVSREKNMASLRLKMKKSKVVRTKKVQSTAKLKKELNWMNMILAVKGLTQKPRKKKVSIKSPNQVRTSDGPEPADSDTSSKCDPGSSGLQVSHKKILSGVSKVGKKCVYKEKNIIKVEEQHILPPYTDDPLSTAVSVKEEEENQCLECNEVFPNIDLLLSHQQGHIEGQPFTCAQCPQSFSTEQYLSIHVNVHAEGPPFRCPECNKTFTRRNHLGVHRRVHTGSRPYACPDCPCRFRQRGSLIIHRYTHRNLQLMMLKPYQCSVCNKSFKQKERLVIHERLHTGECPFSCKDCDKVFPSKSRLYVHRKIHKIPEASSGVEPNASCKEELDGPPFQCKDCDKVCSTKASFVLHRKVHRASAIFSQSSSHEENPEGITSDIPLASEEDLGIKTEQEGHPLSCKDCNKVFSTKASFVLHRKVHRLSQRSDVGSPAFMCKDCGKVCSTKASLVLHRKVHKSPLISDLKATIGDPPYICKLCKKVCSTKASFVLHCKVHKVLSSNEKILKLKEQKSFLCKKCGFVCSTKASFVLHRKVHRSSPNLVQKDGTGQQPFTCKDCNKVCSTKASFVLHCKVHRVVLGSDQSSTAPADMEEKPYHCKDCGKIYSTKGRLLSHLKLHGQDTSADSEQLLKIDTEEKPFACPICHMRFTRLKILVRHKLIHGEDVLRCGHCGKRFLFQKSLMNHVPVCLKRSKAKTLLGKEKVPKKRKMKDGCTNEESAPKKRKNEKKVVTAMQKLKNKKLNKVKKMAAGKEKGKAKSSNEKKIKKPKGETEQEPEGEKQSDGKPEKTLETVSKEKETGKEKKPKDVGKIKKVLKKVPQKQKRQKVNSESLKKWRMIAAATVKKRKLQAVISGGKKKATVKKKGLSKAKMGGKNSKE